MPSPLEFAAQMIARCYAGFRNEHHWQAWLRKYQKEIAALPLPLRKKVLLAHDQASATEFSERRK